jgi:alanyl-tRNA synthetase
VRVIANEEEAFGRTLATGISRFDALASEVQASGSTTISGAEAFRLYDTYGFPFELTMELATDAGLSIDAEEFAEALEQSRARSRAAIQSFGDSARARLPLYAAANTKAVEFLGYTDIANDGTITDIFGADAAVQQLEAGQPGEVVLDQTVFYGESGGQVGDTGILTTETGAFRVLDTQRPTPTLVVHRGEVIEGFIAVGQTAHAAIDAERRAAIRRNHTATHLLHRALRIVLGDDTHQAGSLVAPDRLRFDFTANSALGRDGIDRVAELANHVVIHDTPVNIEVMPYADAVESGAMALFGEKYGDVVRVVSVGDYSIELCGGTHVSRVGEIGPILVLSESSIGSGVRRIEALTGSEALRQLNRANAIANDLARELHVPVESVADEVRQLTTQLRERDRTIEQLRLQVATANIDGLIDSSLTVEGIRVIATRIPATNRDAMLQIGDRLRDKLGSGVIVLAAELEGQPALLAMVTKDLTGRGLAAGKLIGELAPIVGGRGGGRPELAQGGGTDITKIDEALGAVAEVVSRQVTG